MDKRKLIDYVNDLFDRAKMYDAFASITSNDTRAMRESEMSAELLKIAEELDEIIYEKETAKNIIIIWRATQNDPFIHTDNLGLARGYQTYKSAKEEAEKMMGPKGDPNLYFDYRIFELVPQKRLKTIDMQQLIDYRGMLLNRARTHGDLALAHPGDSEVTHESSICRELSIIVEELGKIISAD